jgi:hypothetical protein
MSDLAITTTRTAPTIVKVEQGIFRDYLSRDDVRHHLRQVALESNPGFVRAGQGRQLLLDEGQLLSLAAVLDAPWEKAS